MITNLLLTLDHLMSYWEHWALSASVQIYHFGCLDLCSYSLIAGSSVLMPILKCFSRSLSADLCVVTDKEMCSYISEGINISNSFGRTLYVATKGSQADPSLGNKNPRMHSLVTQLGHCIWLQVCQLANLHNEKCCWLHPLRVNETFSAERCLYN